MIFTKVPRLQIETGPTPRRVKNAARAIEKTRQSWGLFAEVVELETPEARVARMDRTGEAYTQRLRDFEAGCWRLARMRPVRRPLLRLADLNSLPDAGLPVWHPRSDDSEAVS